MSPLPSRTNIEKNGLGHCVGPAILDRASRPADLTEHLLYVRPVLGMGAQSMER